MSGTPRTPRARHVRHRLALGVLALAAALGPPAGSAWADALGDGKKALKKGDVGTAIGHLERAIQDDPGRAEAQLHYGLALERARRWEDALGAFNRAVQLDPRSAEGQRGRGAVLARLGRLQDAENAYRAAMKLDRKFPEAALGLGEVLVAREKYAEANEVLEPGLGWGKDWRPYFHEALGRVEAAQEHFPEAEKHFLQARELEPENPRFHRALGDLYLQRDIPSLAVNSYRQAIALDAGDLDSRFALARAMRQQALYNDALEEYKAILARDSSYAEAYREMGRLYLLASARNPGFLNDSIENLERYRGLHPRDPKGAILLARAYYRVQEKRDEAADLLRPLADAGRLDDEGHAIYGRVLYLNRNWEAAATHLALGGNELEDIDIRRYAHALSEIGDLAAADSLYEARFEADSLANVSLAEASDWLFEAGRMHYLKGRQDSTRYGAAIPRFERKIALDPDGDEAYYYLGLSLRELDRLDEAKVRLLESIERAPNKADRHFWLAAIHLTQDDRDSAAVHFEHAAALDDSTVIGAISRQRLGYFQLLEKDWNGAIPYLEKSSEIDPEQVQTWVWLGQAYQNAGRRGEAADAYRKALELDPQQRDARQGLGQLSSR